MSLFTTMLSAFLFCNSSTAARVTPVEDVLVHLSKQLAEVDRTDASESFVDLAFDYADRARQLAQLTPLVDARVGDRTASLESATREHATTFAAALLLAERSAKINDTIMVQQAIDKALVTMLDAYALSAANTGNRLDVTLKSIYTLGAFAGTNGFLAAGIFLRDLTGAGFTRWSVLTTLINLGLVPGNVFVLSKARRALKDPTKDVWVHQFIPQRKNRAKVAFANVDYFWSQVLAIPELSPANTPKVLLQRLAGAGGQLPLAPACENLLGTLLEH